MGNHQHLISRLVLEAQAYGNNIEDLEKYDNSTQAITQMPAWPIYHSLRASSPMQAASFLPRLSFEQRQFLNDIDLWDKDVVNVADFEFWIEAYTLCEDEEVQAEFVKSEDFLLYLKARVNIWTFDTEDPQYPDHDHYFLTDDNLLLIEYHENYPYVSHLRELIRKLYADCGVEEAYSLLFKLINDNFSLLQEDTYHAKTDRLRDYGLVDYYEAKQLLYPLRNINQLDTFVKNKKANTLASVDDIYLNQIAQSKALSSYRGFQGILEEELYKITEESRKNYLQFCFVRLVNSTLILDDALKAHSMQLTAIAKKTLHRLNFALSFLKYEKNISGAILDNFDFFDLYKISETLLQELMNPFQNMFKSYSNKESFIEFLGPYWKNYIELLHRDIPEIKYPLKQTNQVIDEMEGLRFALLQRNQLQKSLPYIARFYQTYQELVNQQLIQDAYYLNFNLDDIDFEAILVTLFARYYMGERGELRASSLALDLVDFKKFLSLCFKMESDGACFIGHEQDEFKQKLVSFCQDYGLDEIPQIDEYITHLLIEHLESIDYSEMNDEDYAHIGGVILLQL